MMLHTYIVILAIVLLVGALAAIIICICVDIVPIIKSRGSTLVSRDSVTQEQTRMLKKSLQRSKLTSSASADFVESMKGRKTLAQALRKAERPRFGSTPLSLLTGRDEDAKPDVEYKTTTVIIEALPKKTIAESNNNNDVTKINSDVTVEENVEQNLKSPTTKATSPFALRKQNIYTEKQPLSSSGLIESQSQTNFGSSPNVAASRRTKSADLLDSDIAVDVPKGSMTYNARDVITDKENKTRSYPNSPNIRTSRSMPLKDKATEKSLRESPLIENVSEIPRRGSPMRESRESPHKDVVMNARKVPVPNSQNSLRSKHRYMQYGRPPMNCAEYIPERGLPPEHRFSNHRTEYANNRGNSPTQPCSSQHCKWCQIEQERSAHSRHLPFRRTESFPENYQVTSSPRLAAKQLPHQHSFNEGEAMKLSRGFPYDRNKYCKNPHRGYSPCPDCFHSNHGMYYPNTYHGESPESMQSERLSMMGNSPKSGNTPIPVNPLTSSSSSSTSSSGSSSRFRHLRQPLEDIQEDASDCYVIRDITSTIDSRELNSNDDTMPKSTDDNSVMSVSPMLSPEKPAAFVSASGS